MRTVVARINERFNIMSEKYNKACRLFNENPELTEPFDFFAVFHRFFENFKASL